MPLLSRENYGRHIIDKIIRQELNLSWKTLAKKKEQITGTFQAKMKSKDNT